MRLGSLIAIVFCGSICCLVTIRIGRGPCPTITTHIVNRELRLPTKLLQSSGRNCAKRSDVACPPRCHHFVKSDAAGALKCRSQLEYGDTAASAQVYRLMAHEIMAFLLLGGQRSRMSLCQVSYVDIVAYAGAIRSRPV